jgi:predicted nucleic acid-binding Zn ribbon protein
MQTKNAPQTVRSVLESMLAQRGLLSVCRDNEALQKWPLIVGDKIAAVSTCDRVENGLLYVHVDSSPWRMELSYMKPDILKKIRSLIKGCTIHDIVFS